MRVAVLGGGLQGACIAMELASWGIGVDVYDKNDSCVSQASAHNEGKIHLGYVYANDPSLCTARMMIKGAISFAGLMRRWLGSSIDGLPVSKPFHYAVHSDSLLSIEQITQHFHQSHAIALEESRGLAVDYFGADYRWKPDRLTQSERSTLFDDRHVAAAFQTQEVGIDPEALAVLVRARLNTDPEIRCVLNASVVAVAEARDEMVVTFEIGQDRSSERYDHVVNALWDGRLAIDHTFGLKSDRPSMYRVKHFLWARGCAASARLPSTTLVLGAFGDVVAWNNGKVYLSWYPAGMTHTSLDLSPAASALVLDESRSATMRSDIFNALKEIVPSLRDIGSSVPESEIRAGIIVAWGRTDIQDRTSGLHQRHAIGPKSYGRYHTVDTGKLTTAPLFGKSAADTIRLQN